MISRLLLVKLHTMNQNIQNDCRKLKMMETLYHIQLQHKCLVTIDMWTQTCVFITTIS